MLLLLTRAYWFEVSDRVIAADRRIHKKMESGPSPKLRLWLDGMLTKPLRPSRYNPPAPSYPLTRYAEPVTVAVFPSPETSLSVVPVVSFRFNRPTSEVDNFCSVKT